jgi:predicted class III extradiol MEMO1 family dioxygenase
MHIVNIFIKQSTVPCVMGFKTKNGALAAQENVKELLKRFFESADDALVVVKSDFDHVFCTPVSHIDSVMMFDFEENLVFEFEKAIVQRRTDEKLLDRRSKDMELMRLFPGQGMNTQGIVGGRQ